MVQQHADTWLNFRHIWKIPKKNFMLNYIAQKPKASDFDYDITRYIDLAQEVQARETNVQVHLKYLIISQKFMCVDHSCILFYLVLEPDYTYTKVHTLKLN